MLRQGLLPMLGGILLAGCMHAPSTATGHDEADCLASGGRWAAITMLQAACSWPTTDTGSRCTDDAQCQGLCVPADDAYRTSACARDDSREICSDRRVLMLREGDTATGVCASEHRNVMPANCRAHIANGRLVIEACAN